MSSGSSQPMGVTRPDEGSTMAPVKCWAAGAVLAGVLLSAPGGLLARTEVPGHEYRWHQLMPRASCDDVEDIDAMAAAVRKSRPQMSRGGWQWDRLLSRYVDGGRKEKNALKILHAYFMSILDRYYEAEKAGHGHPVHVRGRPRHGRADGHRRGLPHGNAPLSIPPTSPFCLLSTALLHLPCAIHSSSTCRAWFASRCRLPVQSPPAMPPSQPPHTSPLFTPNSAASPAHTSPANLSHLPQYTPRSASVTTPHILHLLIFFASGLPEGKLSSGNG